MLRKPKNIPRSPGVYIFLHGKTPIYIGKAANLQDRVSSYFQPAKYLTAKTRRMVAEATSITCIKTASEVEALIREAELIKKFRPRYNILMRDDKTYFYVGITKEQFPKIFITHAPEHNRRLIRRGAQAARFLGPFTSSSALRDVLKLLRRVFPYCTCKTPHTHPCLNSEIGRCYGICCAIPDVSTRKQKLKMKKLGKAYRKNIRSIAAVLAGGRPRLVATLRREMAMAAKLERYEEAARLRDQLLGLEDVFLHRPVLRATDASSAWTNIERLIRGRLGIMRPIKRIEGYDISNIAGSEPTGAMVVFVDGVPDRSQYRRFRIKTVPGISDVAMHQEMLRRRFIHSEWAYPDIIVIDGGKPQLHAAVQALRTSRVISRASPPTIVALAKREEELYIEGRAQPLRLREENPALLHLFQRVRDESHRFARKYHHFLRRKSLTHTRTE